MGPLDAADAADGAEQLGRQAVEWMLLAKDQAAELDPSLYHGQAGILLALLEAAEHFNEPRYEHAAQQCAQRLLTHLDTGSDASLYFGTTGVAYALDAAGFHDAARRALDGVRAREQGGRWGPMFELLAGNAGIALGALAVGASDLAVHAVEPYLHAADETRHGVNWPVRPTPARSHHMAHGTLGIVYALASVGHVADRQDLVELALRGAADVVARNEQQPDGFLVPHSDPPHRPDIIERYSLGWCNGPTGDAQVFRLLHHVTADAQWSRLADHCWYTVVTSGLPRRIRPGFWDNHGRCCGTAGVLALAVDRIVDNADTLDFATRLVDNLAEHAIIDELGARWSNYEHRARPSALEPRSGWAMGNAGIVRELLRYARVVSGGPSAYRVPWVDHPRNRRARPFDGTQRAG